MMLKPMNTPPRTKKNLINISITHIKQHFIILSRKTLCKSQKSIIERKKLDEDDFLEHIFRKNQKIKEIIQS